MIQRELIKKLKSEYGIHVKKVSIRGTLNYYGDEYYIPYVIRGSNAGSIVDLYDGKVYKSVEQILKAVKEQEIASAFLKTNSQRKIEKENIVQEKTIRDIKVLMAFDILKKKEVDFNWIRCCRSLEEYNQSVPSYKQLNQEEFDSIKEVL